jgi:hypothetical protein
MRNNLKLTTTLAWKAIPLFLVFTAIAVISFTPPFRKWTRLYPIPSYLYVKDSNQREHSIRPVVKEDGKFVMLCRTQDQKGTSSLGYATSEDGNLATRGSFLSK